MENPVTTDGLSTNIKLIYDYTEQAIKVVDASIDRLNLKLGLVFSLDIILIYFFISIADITPFLHCTLCLILRIISYHFLIFSLCFCLSGFKPKKSGSLILPEELIEKCLTISDYQYRVLIVESWNRSIKDLAESRDLTSVQLDSAIANLALAAIFAAISAMASVLLG
jgi:hypothetical protein